MSFEIKARLRKGFILKFHISITILYGEFHKIFINCSIKLFDTNERRSPYEL